MFTADLLLMVEQITGAALKRKVVEESGGSIWTKSL
jgi:hypothetical protein